MTTDGDRSRRSRGIRALDALSERFRALPGVDGATMFGSPALKVHGKVFGFVGTEGELIVKVPADRATALVDQGVAERTRIGRNAAREWVGISLEHAELWSGLLEESRRYVADGSDPG
ncbi:MmcQ/YjbR family DNA-binding protein [Georgenia alba]|uniref:MmcQ/YjbR family DNA-binding protein n=1 Tax=Georgenia alba TaxID=2233858 RepID=A0ABW2Q2R5_9MICO